MWICINMEKIRLFHEFVLEISLIEKSEHFGSYHYRTNLVKINDQIFNRFKKSCFWPIFGSFSKFLWQKVFPENPALSHTTSYSFLAPCQNLEKPNDAMIQENVQTDKGWTEGQKDGQALFYRTLPATSRGSKKHLLLIVHQTKNLFLLFLPGTKKMAIKRIILNLKKSS